MAQAGLSPRALLAGLLLLLVCRSHCALVTLAQPQQQRRQPLQQGVGAASARDREATPGSDAAGEAIGNFHSFIDRYGREYRQGSSEYKERLTLFSQRAAEVEQFNSRLDRRWTAGINALSDRTERELAQLRGWRGGIAPQRSGRGGQVQHHSRGHGKPSFLSQNGRAAPLPEQHSKWAKLKTLGHAKNQGGCGSCWAITAVTVLEAHAEIYGHAASRTFSAQELLSCVANPFRCGGDGGCEGATVELAFDYAMKHGLAHETEDPYQGITSRCSRPPSETPTRMLLAKSSGRGNGTAETEDLGAVGVHIAPSIRMPGTDFGMHAWERLPENQYEPLLRAVVEWGPVGVSVSAEGWYAYSSGIFDTCSKNTVIDHAVALIGFGKDDSTGEKFWLIQNSWGKDWGENGRVRLLRRDNDATDHCGVDSQPEMGTGCRGGPKKVNVCGMCGILYDSTVPHFRRP